MGEDAAKHLEHPVDLERAEGWVGFKLDDISGAGAGRIEGVFVDDQHRGPTWLVIRTGLLGRRSAIPFELAADGVGRIWVPCPKQLIRSAPEVDPAAGLDRDRELELCDHFGLPEGAGRRAELAGRATGRTSVLATGRR